MGKRLFCLICAAVLMAVSICGVRVVASAWGPVKAAGMDSRIALTKSRVNHRPNALVSAMFLVLAGVGVSLLFDKKG